MRRIAMLVSIPLVCGIQAQAQTNACCHSDLRWSQATSQSDSLRVAEAIASQSRIRIRLREGDAVLYGPLVVNGPSIAFDSAYTGVGEALSNPVELPLVLRLDIRSRRPFWGLIIGGGAGAVAGVHIGEFYETFCLFDCSGGTYEYSVGEGFFYGLAGAAAGAVLGGIIDSLIPRWRTVYERIPG